MADQTGGKIEDRKIQKMIKKSLDICDKTQMAQVVYTIVEYTPKSIVLRSTPDDFFQLYRPILESSELMGKWNSRLKSPNGGEEKLPGWIFPKKHQDQVKDVVEKIVSGKIPPPKSLQEMISGQALHIENSGLSSPLNLPLTSITGYQQVTYTVLKPEVGGVVQLCLREHKFPMKIESVQTDGDVIDQATFSLADGQRGVIRLEWGRWHVVGLNETHMITL